MIQGLDIDEVTNLLGTFKELFRDGRFKFSFVVVCVLVLLAILSFFCPYDLEIWNIVPRDLSPSLDHILGTSSKGQDVFWEATFAIRNSLSIALVATFISRVIALIVGLIAGYKGGRVDRILMSFNDSFVVLPLLPVLILIASVMRESMNIITLGIILGIFGWAWDARVIRSQILSLREREFTYTAILSGAKTLSLILKEYLPFITPLMFSTIMNNMSWAIGMEITLAILGLFSLEIPTLGTMIHWAVNYQAILLGYWWWILTPVILCIFLFVALYLLSVSLSQYLDPRTRVQRIGRIGG